MKVAVSCDDILERSHITHIIESFIELEPEAEMYTYSHNAGAVLGNIELRRIFSSFLTHKINTPTDFVQYAHLIPSAAKNLFIPCSVDLILNVSNGFSHGIKKCEKTKQVTYLYKLPPEQKGWFNKIFKGFVTRFGYRSLNQVDVLIVPTKQMKEVILANPFVHLKEEQINVWKPPFDTDDYPVINSPVFTYDHYVVHTGGLSLEMAKALRTFFVDNKIKFKFAGNDSHLEQMKSSAEDPHFFGNRCSGELAPLLSGAKGVIDLSVGEFPEFSLKALSCGRPVLAAHCPVKKMLLKDTGVNYCEASVNEVLETLKSEHFQQVDPKKLHTLAEGFHSKRFKSKAYKLINTFGPAENGPECC